ncbi:SDR family oxidoreductase [Saccharothrix sp. Mg75]|uniref:SDR family oxidoreductase n=1 Tax=Saccharothrix sp. Mg75 TaxID=3445357 RepID=UPI003EEA5E93
MGGNEYLGKVALVTGGGNGLGAAIAWRLANGGAKVVVADVDAVRGKQVADDIGGVFVECDVRAPGDNEAAVGAATTEFGGLDIAVLNAGVVTTGEGFSAESYRRVVATNLDGVVYGIEAVLPALRARGGGSVLVMASLAGLVPVPFEPVYGATKAAVTHYVRSYAPLVASDGIRINALNPGFADTTIIDGFKDVIRDLDMEVLDVSDVVTAFEAALASSGTGECWYVLPDLPAEPMAFAEPPNGVPDAA